MNFSQALEVLKQGGKVRLKQWPYGGYIDESALIVDLDEEDFFSTYWEIYEESKEEN